MASGPTVTFTYRNHRGQVGERTVTVDAVQYMRNVGYGYADGWFLSGYCHRKRARRIFALCNISVPIPADLLPAVVSGESPVTDTEKRALVVLSGGQDSTTCLGWALHRYDHVRCITFDYGQRHAAEVEAAVNVVDYFARTYDLEVPHEVVRVPDVLVSASPLTDRGAELETYGDHDSMAAIIGDRVEKTFVPMRNTLFLTIAANRAVAAGCRVIITGVCQGDNANYPDCREDFIHRLEYALNASLMPGYEGYVEQRLLHIQTPLMHLSKADTVRLALDTPYTYGALAWSHTAYDGQYPPAGRDHASVLRAHGFEQAGRPDPLVLRAVHEGLMPMPDAPNYAGQGREFTEAMRHDWEQSITRRGVA